jgi:hypothetical protein
MVALAGFPALLLWWIFFSRAAWSERLGAVALMVAAVAATPLVLHRSIAEGAMGFLFYVYVIPVLSVAFVVWAVATRRLPDSTRRLTLVLAVLAACGVWTLFRTGGFTGAGDSDFAWRWSPTPEERLLARTEEEPPLASPPPLVDAVIGDLRHHDFRLRGFREVDVVDADAEPGNDPALRHLPNHVARDLGVGHQDRIGVRGDLHDRLGGRPRGEMQLTTDPRHDRGGRVEVRKD